MIRLKKVQSREVDETSSTVVMSHESELKNYESYSNSDKPTQWNTIRILNLELGI